MKFSDAGIQQLREASLKAISFLCLDMEELDPIIDQYICQKAIRNAFSATGVSGPGEPLFFISHFK